VSIGRGYLPQAMTNHCSVSGIDVRAWISVLRADGARIRSSHLGGLRRDSMSSSCTSGRRRPCNPSDSGGSTALVGTDRAFGAHAAVLDGSLPAVLLTWSCRDAPSMVNIVFGDRRRWRMRNDSWCSSRQELFCGGRAGAAAHGNDLAAIANRCAPRLKKGAALYMPLRAALTGVAHGLSSLRC